TAVTTPDTEFSGKTSPGSAIAGLAIPIARKRPAAADPTRACLSISDTSLILGRLSGPRPPRRLGAFAAGGGVHPTGTVVLAGSACGSVRARCEAADRVLRGTGAGDRPQVASRDRPTVGVGDTEPGYAPSGAPVVDDHGLVAPPEDPLVGPLAQRGEYR